MEPEKTQAAPQPAPTAQPSGGEKKSGAANSTVSAFAASLVRKEQAQQKATADAVEQVPSTAETPVAETAPIPAPEETQVPPTEANPEATETTEQVATETEEKADEALSHENLKLDPKLQAKIDKRLAKLAVENKALKAQVSQLREQSQVTPQTEQIRTVPVPSNLPLAQVQDSAQLAEIERVAKNEQRLAEELLDRDDIANGVQLGDRTYSKAQLKQIVRESRVIVEDQVPARRQFLAEQNQERQRAENLFPYLKDRASDEYATHQAALKANPWLLSQPNADYIVAVQLEGLRAIAAKTKAPEKKAVAPKPKPAGDQTVTSDASTVRVPVNSLGNQLKAAANKILEGKRGVGAKDFAAYLRQNEQIRNSR